ncbi:diacylglycerol/lipid kinase family protein [Vibrio vulnificus]|uniref:diacylglycerol/lipid kinase family protein n=1 Tax=Vibrio vulnificus TaxID=672 RepID=UPI001EEA534F|nr:acylglycerol kinase family protein [Vibrio vulnificus]MCG6286217.1 acylglycerol kinase family protein [Vibrio vulnificus]
MIWNFILNPQAGGGKALRFWQQLKPLLSQHNIKHHFHQTQYQGHAKVLSKELAEQGERAFVAIGGDGSVNELLQGIFESGCDLQEFVLTVAPQGTGNDWARYHHIPKRR